MVLGLPHGQLAGRDGLMAIRVTFALFLTNWRMATKLQPQRGRRVHQQPPPGIIPTGAAGCEIDGSNYQPSSTDHWQTLAVGDEKSNTNQRQHKQPVSARTVNVCKWSWLFISFFFSTDGASAKERKPAN